MHTDDLAARRAVFGGIAGVAALASLAHGGPLDPPAGPVTPTGKTLNEVEPRTPLTQATTPGDATAVFIISQPGNYYLAGDLVVPAGKAGVRITASAVTLDLMGFRIDGGGAAGNSGVVNPTGVGLTNVMVRNGSVVGCGAYGVGLYNCSNGTVEDMTVRGCGLEGVFLSHNARVIRVHSESNSSADTPANGAGIKALDNAVIDSCTVLSNTGRGISLARGGLVRFCLASKNTGNGIQVESSSALHGCAVVDNGGHGTIGPDLVTACAASGNTQRGIFGGQATIQGCTSRGNRATGISASGGTIEDCAASLSISPTNVAHGFDVTGATMNNCAAFSNAGVGINSTGVARIAHCASRLNLLDGIVASGTSLVAHNSCSGNGTLALGSGAGVRFTGSAGRIEGNLCAGNSSWGVSCTGSGNMIVGNVSSLNTTNWSISPNNIYGPVVDRTSNPGQGMLGNGTVASTTGSTDPFANFTT